MVSDSDARLWRLKLNFPSVLEESLFWKLGELGIHRSAVQYSPEDPSQGVLLVWLLIKEWPESERDKLICSLFSLAKPFGITLSSPIWDEVLDHDWSVIWKKYWKPDPVGRKLLILPAWLNAPTQFSERIVLKIDPGSAFGTGSHPTTRLCLEFLEAKPPVGRLVADVGCGSGVLGLAALGLGASRVLAVDTDSLAVSSAKSNLKLNCVEATEMQVFLGSVKELKSRLQNKCVDLLLCNILAPVIEAIAPSFDCLIDVHGSAILSGLLMEQKPGLERVLRGLGWEVIAFEKQGDWALLEIRRQ